MSICKCGFNFCQASLDVTKYESYAAIPDDGYVDIIKSEAAIVAEQDESRSLEMIAEGVLRVGSIQICPSCGLFGFSRPQGDAEDVDFMWLRPLPESSTDKSI